MVLNPFSPMRISSESRVIQQKSAVDDVYAARCRYEFIQLLSDFIRQRHHPGVINPTAEQLSLAGLYGGGSSGTPLPSSTGITLTSTLSAHPQSRNERKSSLPPNSQMSFLALSLSARTHSAFHSEMTVTHGWSFGFIVREKTILGL